MDLITKLLVLQVYALVFAAYSLLVVNNVGRASLRLFFAIPAIALNLCAPLLLDHDKEPLMITPVAGCLSLAAFKLLALCWYRGPLALPLTPIQFLSVLLLPIIPHSVFAVSGGQKIPDEAGGAPRGTLQLWADYGKQMGCATVVAVILVLYPNLHWFPRHWLYTLCSCMFLGGFFDGLAAICTSALQLDVAPTFNRPWLCESLADFWARRWNLTTTYMMRTLVYEPIMEGKLVSDQGLSKASGNKMAKSTTGSNGHPPTSYASAVKSDKGVRQRSRVESGHTESLDQSPAGVTEGHTSGHTPPAESKKGSLARRSRPSKLRRFVALQATFMFSGVWHIAVFWYNTRVVSLRWALFFIIQGPLVMVEHLLLRTWQRAGLPLAPRPVRVVLANAFLIAMAGPLFFGPADETGFAQRNLETVKPVVEWVAAHGPWAPHVKAN